MYGGYSKDNLPHKLNFGFYTVNAQSEHEGNGTHWCAFYYNKPLHSKWFDPFGFISNQNVQNKLFHIYNDKDLQDIKSSSCGFYCIAFIKFLHDKRDTFKAFDTF